MTNQWRKKCDEGCKCGKHQAHPCAPGCTCSRHDGPWKRKKCPDGCTCGRHRKQKCDPGCTCSRHDAQNFRKLSPEAKEAAYRAKKVRDATRLREQRAADPETARRKAREQYQANGRKHNLKWKFGITPGQLDALLISQSGRCYLCEEPMNGTIHIDHNRACCAGNRSCGKCIRGLAHQKCNQGIGQFGDDPERLRKVADNLEEAMRKISERT
jgi:hypothetical protein